MSRQVQIHKKAYMPKSKKQQHITPERVWDLISEIIGIPVHFCKEYFYDPCPANTPYKAAIFFNGLYGQWHRFNYINPPFEKVILELFVRKAVEQAKQNRFSIMLLPSKTDQDWFHDIILKKGYEIVWIRKRLQFKNNKHHAPDTHFLVLIK